MKKLLLGVLALPLFISCGYKQYENDSKLKGTWILDSFKVGKSTKSNQVDEGLFTLKFKENREYSAENKLEGKAFDYYFDSNPFRKKGSFEGEYAIREENDLYIREEFRNYQSFYNLSISDNTMDCYMYNPKGKKISLTFKKK